MMRSSRALRGLASPPSDLPVRHVELSGSAALLKKSRSWLGRSEWVRLDERHVRTFKQATGCASPSHVTHEQVLAVSGALVPTVCSVVRRRVGLNYGLEDVEFAQSLTVGSGMRIALRLAEAVRSEGRVDVCWFVVAESERPAVTLLSARMLTRYEF